MKAYCSGLIAGAILVVLTLTGSTALGGLTAYWPFDADFTSSGSRTGMEGAPYTAEGEEYRVSIGTGTGDQRALFTPAERDSNNTSNSASGSGAASRTLPRTRKARLLPPYAREPP